MSFLDDLLGNDFLGGTDNSAQRGNLWQNDMFRRQLIDLMGSAQNELKAYFPGAEQQYSQGLQNALSTLRDMYPQQLAAINNAVPAAGNVLQSSIDRMRDTLMGSAPDLGLRAQMPEIIGRALADGGVPMEQRAQSVIEAAKRAGLSAQDVANLSGGAFGVQDVKNWESRLGTSLGPRTDQASGLLGAESALNNALMGGNTAIRQGLGMSEGALNAGVRGALSSLNMAQFLGSQALAQAQAAGQGALQEGRQLGFGAIDTATGQGSDALDRAKAEGLGYFGDFYNRGMGSLDSAQDRAVQMLGGAEDRGVGYVDQNISAATQGLSPYQLSGQQAQGQQAALNGLLGPQAQAEAIQAFMQSPELQFLRDEGQQAVLRNAAALGGLGGGNVQRDLVRFGQGLASQRFDNFYNRLNPMAQRGLDASSQAGSLLAQGAGLKSGLAGNLGTAGANLVGNLGSNRASLASQLGLASGNFAGTMGANTANLIGQAGLNKAQLAGQAGQSGASLAGSIGMAGAGLAQGLGSVAAQQQVNAASNLASLMNAGGLAQGSNIMEVGGTTAGLRNQASQLLAGQYANAGNTYANMLNTAGVQSSNVLGDASRNLANTYLGGGLNYANLLMNQAAGLAQNYQSLGNQITGLPGIPGVQHNPGIIGNVGNALMGLALL